MNTRLFRGCKSDKSGVKTVKWAALSLVLILSCGCESVPGVPETLQVPRGEKPFLHTYAKGVHVYRSDLGSAGPDKYTWNLEASEAMLFEDCGSVIGSFFIGPTWEYERDGTRVVGEIINEVPSPHPGSIPWMLFKGRTSKGNGMFNKVTHIQCVSTKGGAAPSQPPTRPDQRARIHFTAEYYFYCPVNVRTGDELNPRKLPRSYIKW